MLSHVPEAGKSKLLLPSVDLAHTSNVLPPVNPPTYKNSHALHTGQKLEVKLKIVYGIIAHLHSSLTTLPGMKHITVELYSLFKF